MAPTGDLRRRGVGFNVVWSAGQGDDDVRPSRTIVGRLRRKLDAAAITTYIFTETRVGYRMPKAEAREEEAPTTP